MEYGQIGRVAALVGALFLPGCGTDKGKPFDMKDYPAKIGVSGEPAFVAAHGFFYKNGTFEVDGFTLNGKKDGARYAQTDRPGPNRIYAKGETTTQLGAENKILGAGFIARIGNIIIQCDSPTPTQIVRTKEGDLQYSTSGCGYVENLLELTEDITSAAGAAARSAIPK